MVGVYCIVDGCKSNHKNAPNAGFFRVLRKCPHQTEEWLRVLNKKNPDGSPWTPKTDSKICGLHFLAGIPHKNPSSPSYVPIILENGQHVRVLEEAKPISSHHELTDDSPMPSQDPLFIPPLKTYSRKANFMINQGQAGNGKTTHFHPEEWDSPNDAKKAKRVAAKSVGTWTGGLIILDKATVTDSHFFNNDLTNRVLKTDANCRSICGVTLAFFQQTKALLDKTLRACKVLTKEDQLVVYFQKLKTGETFANLAIFYGTTAVTVSKVFNDILDEHFNHVREFFLWPAKTSGSFKCPTSTAIIDAFEVKVQSQKKVKVILGIEPNGKITFICTAGSGLVNDDGKLSNAGDNKLSLKEKAVQRLIQFKILKLFDCHMRDNLDYILVVLAHVINCVDKACISLDE